MNKIKKRIKQLKVLLKFYYYKVYCLFFRKKADDVWIISERGFEARDNGYHLFKYICNNYPEINVKYIIDKKSADYEKVKEIGSVVDYGSKEHYLLFITAKILISTHIMGFSPDEGLFSKLCAKNKLKINGKYIFLQHGIIKDYLPSLEKSKTMLSMFVTSAKDEHEFILDKFGYDENVVKCTGLARYDSLVSNSKNQILVMPTFRKWMSNYSDNEFMETDFYKNYNSLLNNEALIKFLNDNNYKLYFYPHFVFQKFTHNFKSNSENIVIASINEYDIQKLLIESKILITDFSSVFFDFAYMNKPIIYFQFDEEEYRKNHYVEGYFNYKSNGFGPVIYDEDKLIKYIQILKEQKFKIESVYDHRIDNFFKYTDKDNCKRIYDEINKIYIKWRD